MCLPIEHFTAMASVWWLLVTVATVTSSFWASVEAIYCHQCDSNQHLHCSELWDHSNSPEPTSCDNLYEANYCIKATGMYGGRIGTFRFCSSRDRGHYCDYVKRPGDDREYRACIYTCSGNGCNASAGLRPWAGGMAALLFVVLALSFENLIDKVPRMVQ